MIESDRPQMTIKYDAEKIPYAYRITKAKKQINTLRICSNLLFHCKKFYANTPEYYGIRTSPVLILIICDSHTSKLFRKKTHFRVGLLWPEFWYSLTFP